MSFLQFMSNSTGLKCNYLIAFEYGIDFDAFSIPLAKLQKISDICKHFTKNLTEK